MNKGQQDIIDKLHQIRHGHDNRRVMIVAAVLILTSILVAVWMIYLSMSSPSDAPPVRIAPPEKVKTLPKGDTAQEDLRIWGLHNPDATAQAEQEDASLNLFSQNHIAPPAIVEIDKIDSTMTSISVPTVPRFQNVPQDIPAE